MDRVQRRRSVFTPLRIHKPTVMVGSIHQILYIHFHSRSQWFEGRNSPSMCTSFMSSGKSNTLPRLILKYIVTSPSPCYVYFHVQGLSLIGTFIYNGCETMGDFVLSTANRNAMYRCNNILNKLKHRGWIQMHD